MKLFITLVFLLCVGECYCNAGTYTSKVNPQQSLQYEEAPEVYLTAGQCKNYSRQNHPGKVVHCRSMLFSHFYLNGEVVDGQMDEIAKTSESETVFLGVFILILIAVAFYVYLIPTFVAYKRNHPQRVFIMLLNLFLGNTLVGWIAAFIWARTGTEGNKSK